MILYQDGFLKLEYDALTDILYVPCPDVQEYELLHVYQALAIVVETIVHYDVKLLLFDASKSLVEVKGEEYQYMVAQLIKGLNTSRLQKLARLASTDLLRENSINLFIHEWQSHLPWAVQNFDNKAAAIEWLLRQ